MPCIYAFNVCLISCMLHACARCVCLPLMPLMYSLYVRRRCRPHMLHVCMPFMYASYMGLTCIYDLYVRFTIHHVRTASISRHDRFCCSHRVCSTLSPCCSTAPSVAVRLDFRVAGPCCELSLRTLLPLPPAVVRTFEYIQTRCPRGRSSACRTFPD